MDRIGSRFVLLLVISAVGCGSAAQPPTGNPGTLGIALRSSAVTIEQAGTASVAVDLVRTNYTKSVAVTLAGLEQAGITADALVIDSSSSTGALVLHAGATSAAGVTTTGTIRGNGGDGSAPIAVTVRARAAAGSLAIVVSPRTVTLAPGAHKTIQIDLTRIDYPNPVIIEIEGLAAAGIDSGTVELGTASGNTAVITLLAAPAAPPGTTTAIVHANGSDATAPLTVTVVRSDAPFSLDVGSPLVTLSPGGIAVALVTVTRLNGFAGAIDVAVAGLPPGVTVDPLTIDATTRFGDLIFRSDGSGSPVTGLPITATGSAGAASASTNFALTLQGLSVFVPSQPVTVGQGQTAAVPVRIVALTSVTGPAFITVTGLPQGVIAGELTIPDGQAAGDLAISATADAMPGTAVATVMATSGSTTATTPLTVTVETNEVAIGVVEPDPVTVAAGTSRRVVVEVTRSGSYRTVGLPIAVTGLPSGVTADPIFLNQGTDSGVLTLHAAADAPLRGPAVASVELRAFPCFSDCGVLSNAPLVLTIVAPFDFTLSTPGVSLQQGATASPVITVTRNGGFVGDVKVGVEGLPDGVSGPGLTLEAGTSSAEMDLTATDTAAAGSSVLTVTLSGPGFTVSHALPLEVFVPSAASPAIVSFAPAVRTAFVGDRTQLTAVFTGTGSIDGIGPVESGQPVDTPVLSGSASFTLRVRRGDQELDAHARVAVGYRNRFRALAPAPVGRGVHLAATLPDGSVLLMGGHTTDAPSIPSDVTAQRFDPIAEATLAFPNLPFFENTPETSSVQLVDGGFLLVGGGINSNSQGLGRDADRLTLSFGPADQRFVRVGNTQQHRHGDTVAAPLLDGGALLTGSADFSPSRSTERFDGTTRHWSLAGSLNIGRRGHTATRLRDGRVLIVGGLTCCIVTADSISQFSTDITEIYDPETDLFTQTGSLAAARSFHTATLLPDGRVLIVGGLFGDDGNPSPANTEVYDPATGEFSDAGALQVARGAHSAVLLTDGRVLVVSGFNFAQPFAGIQVSEIYDPAANAWSAGPTLQPSWFASTVTLLANGKVLIFGGEDSQENPQSTVMLFE